MKRVQDRVVIVTGGGRGIGAATGRRFLAEGAIVAIWEVSQRASERAAANLYDGLDEEARARLSITPVDVTDENAVQSAVEALKEKHGRIDVLVNNAGILADGFATQLELEAWERVLRVNLTGTFICCRAVIPVFRERKSGVIINTSSISALGNKGQANYSASKAGVIGLTKTLVKELAADSIRVNAVAPGVIDTEMFALVPEKVREKFLRRVPLGRLGSPDDIAHLHVFLASDEATYLTGQTIFCDGGISLGE